VRSPKLQRVGRGTVGVGSGDFPDLRHTAVFPPDNIIYVDTIPQFMIELDCTDYKGITDGRVRGVNHMSKSIKVSSHQVGAMAFSASHGGKSAAAAARTTWGDKWPDLKPKSTERQEFNAGALAAWVEKYRERIPVAVRKMGEYRLAVAGETVPDGTGTSLTPEYVMGYQGNALTKLKKENPTLGALVDTQKTKYQAIYADAWRNMIDSYNRLLRDESGENGGNAKGMLKPFGDRLPKYVQAIITGNNAAFERGDVTSYPVDVMDKAAAAFAKVLKDSRAK